MTSHPEGQPEPPPSRLPLSQHISRHLHLAVPVMLARAGLIIMFSVDSIMTGRAGASELAHYAISLAPHITLLVVGIGLLVGTVVLSAQADGAGRHAECGAIWYAALGVAAILGIVAGLILLWGESLLILLGQSPSVAAGGGKALLMFAPGMPAFMMYIATLFFLEGTGRPYAGMVIGFGANFINAGINWVFIYGNLGAPEMGAAGAVLATTITRWIMLFVLIGYTLNLPDGGRYGLGKWPANAGATIYRLLRIGLPLSIAAALETACFSAVTTFAGRLGELPLAGYQIAFNVLTFVFMLAIGLSNATSVRVANAVGRADRHGMAMAGWTGLGLVVVVTSLAALGIALFSSEIAGFYSAETAVLRFAVPALMVVAFMVVIDGSQAVLLGALRGTGDVLMPTLSYALAFWVIAMPAAYYMSLKEDAGIAGLFWALFAGLIVAFVLLLWRFAIVSRQAVRPV